MKTMVRMLMAVGLVAVALGAKPAQAQVSLGVATPGFAFGIGPGAGYLAGGYYPAYPVVVPRPIYAPVPVFVPPPVYGRPYYAGGYGRGYYPHPHYGPPHYGYRR